MPVEAEEVQELGRQGVAIIKRWLEATTYIELPWDAYHHRMDCVVPHLAGKKIFDLCGLYLTGRKHPILVESKRYTSTGRQFKEFQRFLAVAYSATIKEMEDLGAPKNRNYMWVTFHPFNLDNWSKLETRDQIDRALKDHPDLLSDRPVDEDVLRAVADRITVLVFNPKQESLSLTRAELQQFRTLVDRKADSL
jgi:hypothetical protein